MGNYPSNERSVIRAWSFSGDKAFNHSKAFSLSSRVPGPGEIGFSFVHSGSLHFQNLLLSPFSKITLDEVVVTPLENGVQVFCNYLELLDPRQINL
jgi:hypothetical protein